MNFRWLEMACVFSCMLLAACGAQTKTFSFNSNANNVQISVDNQICYTPCQLEIEPSKELLVTIAYDEDFSFYMKPDRQTPNYNKAWARYWLANEDPDTPLLIGTWATLSTVTTVALTTTDMVAKVHHYDTRSYYIYLQGQSYALANVTYIDYVLMNFSYMQQELFATEQPLIDELARLTGLQNIPELLIESEYALTFLDKLTLEKVKQILNSDMSHAEKISTLATLLCYDETVLGVLYATENETEFLEKIESYLRMKRIPLTANTSTYWYMAAELGDKRAQNDLGKFYENAQDYDEAMQWYQKAAEQDYAEAMYNIAMLYLKTNDISNIDLDFSARYAKFEEWYQKAIALDGKYQKTFYELQRLLSLEKTKSYKNFLGGYSPHTYSVAYWAYRGNVEAQYDVGEFYEYGRGIEQSYAKAIEWYILAAERGHTDAQFKLGKFYDYGLAVRQDYAEALKWYTLAAEQNDMDAQNNIGELYRYGQGVEQSYAEALKWYALAAEKGHANAQNNIGEFYEHGLGVKQSYADALRWYTIAVKQGSERAQQNIDRLKIEGKI